MYSVAESVLLCWLEIHMKKILPQNARRLTQFDQSLSDGVALCCVMVSHWPALSRFSGQVVASPVSDAEIEINMRIFLRMMDNVQCPFSVREEQLVDATALDMLFLVAYLYDWLPQLIPKSTVEFAGKLQEEQARIVEVSNTTKKVISYAARLQGHSDFHLEQQSIRIEPGGSAVCRITCTPTTGVTQTGNLILASKRDGGAFAATLVFHLVSKVRSALVSVGTGCFERNVRRLSFSMTDHQPGRDAHVLHCAGRHYRSAEACDGGKVIVRVETVRIQCPQSVPG